MFNENGEFYLPCKKAAKNIHTEFLELYANRIQFVSEVNKRQSSKKSNQRSPRVSDILFSKNTNKKTNKSVEKSKKQVKQKDE